MQTKEICSQIKKHSIPSALIWTSVIALSLIFSPTASEYVKNGISLCIGTVIPSVFPFMVISSLIIAAGAGRDLGALFSLPLRLVFGISRSAACPVFLGLVCGYPTGAFTAAAMYDKGEISKKELERLLTFINVPGAAFVIGAVGKGMLSSTEIGTAIYVSVILASVTVGIFGRLFYPNTEEAYQITAPDISTPLSSAVPSAIRTAAANMMTVSACVITFSALSGIICSLPFMSALPTEVRALITGFFEVSSGTKAASLTSGMHAPLLVSAVCAWSGLSVHMQIISACRGRGVSFLPFFISKAAQALLTPLYLYVYMQFIRTL